MVDPRIVAAKCDVVARCLQRIRDVHGPRSVALQPFDVDDITVLNLQRAIQAAIDLASHVVAEERLGLPESVSANFALLGNAGIITPESALALRRMTGFRNIAVHEYRRIDPGILQSIVENRLGDLEAFASAMLEKFAPPNAPL